MHADNDGPSDVDQSDLAEVVAEVFGMLADPTRVRIIQALARSGELAVGDLAAAVDRKPAAVSQHLAKLRLVRMVAARRSGTVINYRLVDDHAFALVAEATRQAEHTVAEAGRLPAHHLAAPEGIS